MKRYFFRGHNSIDGKWKMNDGIKKLFSYLFLSFKSRPLFLFSILILVILIPIFILTSKYLNPKSEAAWFDDSFAYRKLVPISNVGVTTSNQYIKVTLDTAALISAGKLQNTCNDIRITNISGKLLDHFIDGDASYTCNTTTTSIYIIVDNIPSSGTSLLLYYGNSSATNIEIAIGNSDNPGLSCKTIHNHRNNGNNSGIYYISTNGNINNKTQVYCDMASNGGGWTLMFQRRGGTNNVESCQSTLNAFLRNSCGSISSLNYGDSYSFDLDNVSNYGEFLVTDFNSSLVNDTDDAYIIHSDNNIFPDSINTLQNIPVTSVCDVNNSNCDSVDAYFLYVGNSWFNSSLCNGGYAGSTGLPGNYGYCQNGISTAYNSNGLFGDRDQYNETKLWAHANTAGTYMERVFVRETSYSFSSYSMGTLGTEEKSLGPVAYWKFDEGVGSTAFDSTANKNNGTISGATWKNSEECISGKCLSFDGTSNYVDFGNPSAFNFQDQPMTISVWINPKSSSGGYIFNKDLDSTSWDGYNLLWNGSSVTFALFKTYGSVTGSLTSSSNIPLNQWTHIEATYSGTNMSIYVNGKLDNSTNYSGGYDAVSGFNAIMGRHFTANILLYKGLIDESKIYGYARTATQIKSDYNSGLARQNSDKGTSVSMGSPGSTNLSNGLVGYWKMDEISWNGTNNEIIDSSGNNNNGKSIYGSNIGVGKFGNAGDFNGIGGGVTGPSSTILDSDSLDVGYSTSMSISFWIKNDSNVCAALIKKSGMWEIYRCSANITVRYETASPSDHTGSISLLNSQWYHVVVTRNNQTGNTILYINGQKDSEWTFDIASPNTTGNLGIGGYESGYWTIDGKMDETRIYNRALSPKEVTDLYNFAPGPMGYWDFEEGSGNTAFDKSGNGNNGAITGATRKIGKFGSGYNFSNVGTDKISIGSPLITGTSDFTISSWVYRAANDHGQNIAANYGNGGCTSGIDFYIHTNKVNSYIGTSLYSNTVLNLNNWYYITTTRGNGVLKVFVNGILENTANNSTSIGGNCNFTIGNAANYNGEHFEGILDEVKVYNYARTPGQIVEDMNGGHPLGGSPVGSQLAYWTFDEGYGTVAHDNLNYRNGTLTCAGGTCTKPTWKNDGQSGKSLYFFASGSDESFVNASPINIGSNLGDKMTWTMWVKPDPSQTGGGWLMRNGNGADENYGWKIGSAVGGVHGVGLEMYDTSFRSVASTGKYVPNNSWSHLTITLSQGQWFKIYVNGVFKEQVAIPYGLSVPATSGFFVGGHSGTTGQYLNGYIDELKIYNDALSEDEIKLDYNQGQAMQMGSLSVNTGNTAPSNAASQEYCVPGDTTACLPPVAEWKFEEGVGSTANDTSGNNLNGLWSGSNTHYTSGKDGKAAAFNATNNYITVPNNNLLNFGAGPFTILLWVKSTALQPWVYYIKKDTDSWTNDPGFQLTSGNGTGDVSLYWVLGNGTSHLELPPDGWTKSNDTFGWTNVGLIRDTNNNVYIVINGKTTYRATLAGSISNSLDMYMGKNTSSGAVDNVRLYNYARTPAQIAWDYNKGGPVAHWDFDECQGNIVHDLSGNTLNGTINIGGGGSQSSVGTCSTAGTAWGNGANGKLNASLNFDMNDDDVDVGGATGPLSQMGNTFSMAAWIKTPSPTSRMTIFSTGYSGGGILFGTSSPTPGGLEVYVPGVWIAYTNGSLLQANTWQHVVYTRSGTGAGTHKFYINGVSQPLASDTAGNFTDTNVNKHIGYRAGVVFNGQIDDMRVYNYPLTSTQIKTLFNNGAINFGPATGSP